MHADQADQGVRTLCDVGESREEGDGVLVVGVPGTCSNDGEWLFGTGVGGPILSMETLVLLLRFIVLTNCL